MRLISTATLRAFWQQSAYADAETPLRAWAAEVLKAQWQTPAHIKAQFASASILKGGRVVFNIKGNDYRVVTVVAYKQQAMFVKFVGTHKQYDAINAQTVELSE